MKLTDSDKKFIRKGRAKYARALEAKSKPLSAAKYAKRKAKLTKDFLSKMKKDNPSSMLSDKTFGKPPKSGSAKLRQPKGKVRGAKPGI